MKLSWHFWKTARYRAMEQTKVIKRLDAKADGLKRYFTGKPCVNGHICERYVADWICVKCKEMREFAWRVKNRPRKVATANAWRAANHEWAKASKRAWYAASREAVAAYFKAYNKANPEHARAQKHARRAREMAADGRYSSSDIKRLLDVQGVKCAHAWCRASLKAARYHIDHILPLSLGGSNWPSNIQLLCPKCNLTKNNTHPIDFAQRNGMLL